MKRSIALALSLAFFPPLLALAQSQPAPVAPPTEFIQVVTVTVKPEAVTDYEDYVKKIVASAGKSTAFPRVVAYQVAMGGPAYTYHFVLPFQKWAELDNWTTISAALASAQGEAEAARITKAGRTAVKHSENAVHRLLPDLSTRPRALASPARFAYLVRTEVDPDEQRPYEDFLARLKAAQEQAPDAPSAVRRVSVMGSALTYTTVQFFNKHAERDGWTSVPDTLRKAHGDTEGRRLLDEGTRAVRRREVLVLAHRPDLSVLTAPATR
ncbi:MAG TPA: hypothetical protein VMR21_10240 [Vicinamibacteria bacterium]|nr:hypothetical protein [Vicinamibacteria bacterium]